ncbi:Gfo/Idh/MocA family protein [Zhihengliuella salsuginis]|uniref:Dehydrogenase n=1 Tax=Zhihengliuella salsuginis TaxID=578222 RepID=A0ABQ3GN35_9MICC|nr:Gfo/Idh/MocA family oxidoreductase [Zhihengliuella salsuginis]GHD11784.1 dehydrogenase [Zhihengliuella salsuginis]
MSIRTGLIGLGMMGRHHARVMRSIEGTELVAVADPFGDKHGAAAGLPLFQTVEELIAHGVDAVVCAVPTGLHEEVGLKLAAAGVHVMVEKPIAENVEAGQRLVDAFDSAGLVGAVGHIERFNPALQQMRKRIESGELGDIYQIATRRQGPFPARIADVGVVKDLGTHDIDLTAWIAQSPFAEVNAKTFTASERPHEDMIVATGRLASGVITNHIVNWLSPMKERLTIVTGERGAFVADTVTADLTFYENGSVPTEWDALSAFRGVSEGNVTRYAFAKAEPLKTEHEAFRDGILGNRNAYVSMREGLDTLRVAESMLESADSGSSVHL